MEAKTTEMITYIIQILFLNSIVIQGIRAVTFHELDAMRAPTSKKLFWFVRWYGTKYIGEYFMQPICTCTVCMSSIWGVIIYFPFVFHLHIEQIFQISYILKEVLYLLGYCISLAGLNAIITALINR